MSSSRNEPWHWKRSKKDHDLALDLWATGESHPRPLSILILDKEFLDQGLLDDLAAGNGTSKERSCGPRPPRFIPRIENASPSAFVVNEAFTQIRFPDHGGSFVPTSFGLIVGALYLSFSDQPDLGAIEASLDDWIKRASVPGVSITLVNREGEIGSVYRGNRELGKNGSIGKGTVFRAASLTKPVVAYAALQLVEWGDLSLDAPLAKIAELEDLEDSRRSKITLRHVLSHTSGLPNWRPGRWGNNPQPLPMSFDPGTAWQYSGEGFQYLQTVLETITGQGLDECLRDIVFDPLEMKSSSLEWQERFADDFARGHRAGQSLVPPRNEAPLAAATLLTTSRDYGRFLSAVLRGDELSDETLKNLQTEQVNISRGLGWGLGLGIQVNEQGVGLWQWGHNPGYRAFTMLAPERNWAIVFFTNSDTGMKLLRPILETLTSCTQHPAIDHLNYSTLDDD